MPGIVRFGGGFQSVCQPVMVCSGLLSVLLGAAELSAEWPQWRGIQSRGVSQDADPPIHWSSEEQVAWKVSLPGSGNSSPVVWENQVFITASEGVDHEELVVLCFDLESGKQQWERRFFATPSETPFSMFPPLRGHAAPTPATDGESLVCLFGSGDLICLELDGSPRWIRSLTTEMGSWRNDYGIASSPSLHDGRVIVQIDHQEDSYLLSVHVETGETMWHAPRETVYDNWSSPVIALLEEGLQVICLGTRQITGYDWETGRVMWNWEGLERLCATTPVVHEGRLYVVTGPAGATFAFQLEHGGPKLLWETKKDGPFVPSPLVARGLYFMVTDRGVASCHELDQGERLWQGRVGGQGRPSPVAAADRVYFTDLDGRTTVVEASETFRILAENDIGESVASSPVPVGRRLLIRGEQHLYCLEQSGL